MQKQMQTAEHENNNYRANRNKPIKSKLIYVLHHLHALRKKQ